MIRSNMLVLDVVFFCLFGWVCVGSATGADEGDAPGAGVAPIEAWPEAETLTAPPPLFPDAAPLAAEPAQAEPAAEPVLEENAYGRIDLAIQDQDVVKVLQMLAIQSRRNILPSGSVSGNISASLYDVDFYEALNAILITNGFTFREDGNFIYIYTIQEAREIDERDRRTESSVIWLNFEPAENVAKIIQPHLTPGRGTVAFSAPAKMGFVAANSDGGANSSAARDYLVVHDYPEKIAAIQDLVKLIDIKPDMVEIEATILEARLSEDNAWGVDLTILADFAMSEFTNPLSAISNLATGAVGPSGGAVQTTVGRSQTGSSGMRVGIVTSDVAAFIRALDQVTDTTVLAKPKIVTLNRQAAKLIAGQKLGYISTTATDTSTTQTVEFLEVGTKLTVRPFISNDDFIRLEMQPEISEGEVTPVEGFVIPNETTNELIVNVRVPNGRTVVLGGLFKENTTVTRSQVPVVGDIPLLGAAFQGRDDEVRRSEVIFLVRPTIIKEPTMTAAGDRVADDVELARLGAREGLLFWSRTKTTAGHMADAERHLAEGREDKALMSVNMALSLDATLVEAHRLREKLTQERLKAHDSGIMDRHLNGLIEEQLRNGSN